MDINKFKGLTIGQLAERAQALADKLEPTNPDFANDLALSLLKGIISGNEDLTDIISLFGSDEDISNGLFPVDTEPVTVTKTTTSVGGISPEDLTGTPEEQSQLDDLLAENNISLDDDATEVTGDAKEKNKPPKDLGDTPEEKELLLDAMKSNKEKGEPAKDMGSTPEEKAMLKQSEDNSKDKSDNNTDDKTSAEKAADKVTPAEDKTKKDGAVKQTSTDRNILAGILDRI